MQQDVLVERLFTALISGSRPGSREVMNEVLDADWPAQKILSDLFWPTLQHIQKLYRADQLTNLAHHYATRLMRTLTNQMELRLEQSDRVGKKLLVSCGPEESEELGAQLTADLLEAAGYDVYFTGGGIANDEIVSEIGEASIDILVVFGAMPSTVPETRLLIDRLHQIGVCPSLQIVVGGGVFNRANGLAEEIGADLWANNPLEIVKVITEQPTRRMTPDQRTVGRKRRNKRSAA